MGSEPTGELVRRLIADLAALVRLYGREIRDYVRGLGRDVVMAAIVFAVAASLAFFALGVVIAVLILVADIWLPGWAAALFVLGIMVAAIGVLVWLGMRRLRRRQAVWSARMAEEVRWLRSLFQGKS
ncbi:MAG: phage holin family protein [Candidatus Methylomirabilaceae bacterium]